MCAVQVQSNTVQITCSAYMSSPMSYRIRVLYSPTPYRLAVVRIRSNAIQDPCMNRTIRTLKNMQGTVSVQNEDLKTYCIEYMYSTRAVQHHTPYRHSVQNMQNQHHSGHEKQCQKYRLRVQCNVQVPCKV
jgi:hypothetical protein